MKYQTTNFYKNINNKYIEMGKGSLFFVEYDGRKICLVAEKKNNFYYITETSSGAGLGYGFKSIKNAIDYLLKYDGENFNKIYSFIHRPDFITGGHKLFIENAILYEKAHDENDRVFCSDYVNNLYI